jgi:hypothetical protein
MDYLAKSSYEDMEVETKKENEKESDEEKKVEKKEEMYFVKDDYIHS